MRRKKSLVTLLFAASALTTVFAFAACEEDNAGGVDDPILTPTNDASLVAGTYKNTLIDSEKYEYTLTVENDGAFELAMKETDGIYVRNAKLGGALSVDDDRNVTALKLTDISGIAGGEDYVFGNLLPSNTYDSIEMEYILNMLGDKLSDFVTLDFSETYLMMDMGYEPMILYKEGAERLARDTELSFYTEKDLAQLEGLSISDILMGDTQTAPYESEYYFVKNAHDLTSEEGKKAFNEELSEKTRLIVADYLGNPQNVRAEVKEATGFDLTKTGTGNGTIKYAIGENTVSKSVTYTVVEKEEALPLNQLRSLEARYGDNAQLYFAEKGTKAYALGWELRYQSFGDYGTGYIAVNEKNCSGDTKVIDIVGYDENKTGYQAVTVKYRGKEVNFAVFVYDDTVKPVRAVSISGKVVIKKTNDGTKDVYTLDCSGAKFSLNKYDTSDEVTFTAEDAVNLDELKNYKDGDTISFVYEYEFDGKKYTFYAEADVEIVDETAIGGNEDAA